MCFLVQEHQIAAHEQLYQDAIRRRLRQEEMAHWFPEDVTFQPTLETGGHHADSTKVMADPTLNVSDRSAVFPIYVSAVFLIGQNQSIIYCGQESCCSLWVTTRQQVSSLDRSLHGQCL